MRPRHLLLLLLLLPSACRNPHAERLLAAAESVAAEHPDSVLRLLGDPLPAGSTRREQARRRLLLAQACNRTGTLRSDTLILPALAFFERHGSDAERARAWYYYGAANLADSDLDRAVRGFSTALLHAERAAPTPENRDFLAGLCHTLGGLCFDQGHTRRAAEHFARASRIWEELRKPVNRRYSDFMLAMCRYAEQRYTESLRLLDALPAEPGDALLTPLMQLYRVLLHAHAEDLDPADLLAARNGIDRKAVCGMTQRQGDATISLSPATFYYIVSAIVFHRTGQTDSASHYVTRALERIDGFTQGTAGLLSIAGSVARERGDAAAAYEYERRHGRTVDSIYRAERSLQVAELEQRYRTQYETALRRTQRRYRTWIGLLAGLLALSAAVRIAAGYRRKLRQREEQLHEYLALADSYRASHDSLVQRLDATDAREAAVKQVLEGRMAALRDIAATCYTYGTGERLAERIRSLALNPAMLRDIGRMADLYYDRAVERLRSQLPGWTERNYDFAALVVAGFSPQEISVLLGMSLNGVYTCKSKLKRRIAASEAPDRAFFLAFFA